MPVLLDSVVQIPTVYQPWYIYTAELVASPAAFTFLDILFPDSSGNFDRLVTDDAVLTDGYAFACQAYTAGMTEVQVLVPGSVVPFIAFDNSMKPLCMVKFNYAASVQTAIVANAADFAAGKVIGRYRCQVDNSLALTATNDVIMIHTGCC